jgi:hypothetical protein
MSSESVCQVARSWVDVGSFHTCLFGVVYFAIASVREFLATPSYRSTIMYPLLSNPKISENRTFLHVYVPVCCLVWETVRSTFYWLFSLEIKKHWSIYAYVYLTIPFTIWLLQYINELHGDQKVSVHLMMTVQKTRKIILNSFNHLPW